MNHTQKTFTAKDVLAARLQGRKEAEEFLDRRIDLIARTHREMLIQIMNIDRMDPVTQAGVLIPYNFAHEIIKRLNGSNIKNYRKKNIVRRIKYYMRRSDKQVFGGVDMSKVLGALANNENGI